VHSFYVFKKILNFIFVFTYLLAAACSSSSSSTWRAASSSIIFKSVLSRRAVSRTPIASICTHRPTRRLRMCVCIYIVRVRIDTHTHRVCVCVCVCVGGWVGGCGCRYTHTLTHSLTHSHIHLRAQARRRLRKRVHVCVCIHVHEKTKRESMCVYMHVVHSCVRAGSKEGHNSLSPPFIITHVCAHALSPPPLAPELVRCCSHSRGRPPWPACAATLLQEACVMRRLCTYSRLKCTHGRLSEARMQTPTCSVDVKCELLQTSHMHRVLRSVRGHFSSRAPEFARAPARPDA